MTHGALTADVGERNDPTRIAGDDGAVNKRSAKTASLAVPDVDIFPHGKESIRRSNNVTMKITAAPSMSSLIVLSLFLLSAITSIHAQDDDVCSCSPREYFFKLDLSATCPPNPPPFPPNDVFGAGVSDYTCAISPEPSSSNEKRNGEQVRRRLNDEMMQNDDGIANIDDFVVPTIVDPEPVVIDSIQFFESDTDFNVINQDPSYVRDISFVNGDIFNYTSISDLITTSSKGTKKIPGGISMVLRGRNAAGERVRNTFSIRFTNECGVPTFEVGEAIGWVVFESLVPASQETCRSIQESLIPTPSPSYGATSGETNTPTPSPGNSITSGQPNESTPNPVTEETPSPSYGEISGQPTAITPNPAGEDTASPSSGNEIISGKPNGSTPNPVAGKTPEPSGYGTPNPTRRPSRPAQSKPPTALSYDFHVMYSEFEPEPKADKVEPSVGFAYQFHPSGAGARPNKSGKSSSSGGKSGKSGSSSDGKSSKSSSHGSKSSKSSSHGSKSSKSVRVHDYKELKDEPVRGLRATLARMDVDRGAKPSNHIR